MSTSPMALETVIWSSLIGILAAAIVEPIVGLKLVRPRVREDTAALVEKAKVELLADLRATGTGMRGGVDPRDLAARRILNQEERDRWKAIIYAEVAKRSNPLAASLAMKAIPRDIMDAACRAGERWGDILEPVLASFDREEEPDDVPRSWNDLSKK